MSLSNITKNRLISWEIFSRLDFESLLACRLVCKSWYDFLQLERQLWTKIMENHMWYIVMIQLHLENPQQLECYQWAALFKSLKSKATPREMILMINVLKQFELERKIWNLFCLNLYGPLILSAWLKNLNFLHLLVKFKIFSRKYLTPWSLNQMLIWAVEHRSDVVLLKFILPFVHSFYHQDNYKLLITAIQRQEKEKLRLLSPFLRSMKGNPEPFVEAINHQDLEMIHIMVPNIDIEDHLATYLNACHDTGNEKIFQVVYRMTKKSPQRDEFIGGLVGNYAFGSKENMIFEFLIGDTVAHLSHEKHLHFSAVRNLLIWAVNARENLMDSIVPFIYANYTPGVSNKSL